ncbi:MAG: DUF1993 domain-containing protein [Pseudomonas fluorescens]|nr:MAG: DUF1993 domain-containing protein [Pseudomonas fluorescens]
MSLTMYSASVPVVVRSLENLSAILAKGQAYAAEQGIDEASLTTAKLAEDMFPLVRQIQLASDSAKGMGARLAGVDVPSMDDNEVTIADLQARIEKTISFLNGLESAAFDGAETKEITFSNKGGSYEFNGRDYLFNFVFPNFFFHVTTAYDILRHKGVNIGKKDFLGAY